MATTLQFRRYTTAELSSITGANGELILDTNRKTLTVHDGSTSGGHALVTYSVSDHIIPDTDVTYDLGSATNRFRDIYLSGSTIDLGGILVSASSETGLVVTDNTGGTPQPLSVSLSANTTDDLSEGSSNLYYTDARVQSAISVDSTLDYSAGQVRMPSTGVAAGEYGSASQVPVFTVDAQGRITAATTTNVAGVSNFTYTAATNTFTISTADGGEFTATGDLSSFDTDNLSEGLSNLYYTDTRVDTWLSTKTTDNVTEGSSNLYYTDVRVDTWLSGKTTDNVTEGSSNLYYTDSRVDQHIATLSTDDLSEGSSNLYYTDSRARAAISVTDSGGDGSLSYDSGTGIITYTGPSAAEVQAHFTAGSGLTYSSGEYAHADTSTQADVTNTGGNVIQSVTLDTFGHIATLTSVDLDGRYYTETESDTRFVNVAGDTMTGFLTLNADPTNTLHAATKAYVDSVAAGLDWKNSVNLFAASNVSLTGTTGTLVIDGHAALTSADTDYRILLTAQTTDSENGIYDYTDDGSNYTLVRSSDADTYQEMEGISVFVMEGDTYGNTSWVQTNHYLTDFTGQTWTQFSGPGTYTAGGGLTLTGTTFAHEDTSTQTNLSASARTYVTGLTFDTYGHVTGLTTGTETVTDTTYTAGTGLSLSGTQFSISNTSVTANSYGSASQVATFTVNSQGQLTAAGSTNIAISSSAVSGLAASATTDTTNASNITSGTLTASRLPTSGVTATTYGTTTAIPSIAVDSYGRITSATTQTIAVKTINSTSMVGTGNVSVQPTLVSGTNIKTINSTSLLGSGDVSVQPTLVSGTNIKTINSTSLLGSGDIAIDAQPHITATAYGSISAGSPVVVNEDGTVSYAGSVPVQEIVPLTFPVSIGDVFIYSSIEVESDPFDPNTIIVAYKGDLSQIFVRVGTISGNTVTYSDPTLISSSGISTYSTVSLSMDPFNSGKFIVAYSLSSSASVVTARVCKFSGGNITVIGDENTIYTETLTINSLSIAYDRSTSGRLMFVWIYGGNYPKALAASVSGTTITPGISTINISSNSAFIVSVASIPKSTGLFVSAWTETNNNWVYAKAIRINTDLSLTAYTFTYVNTSATTSTSNVRVAADYHSTSGLFSVLWKNTYSKKVRTYTVSDVSGSITYRDEDSVYTSTNTYGGRISYDPTVSGRAVVSYRDNGGNLRLTKLTTNLSTYATTTSEYLLYSSSGGVGSYNSVIHADTQKVITLASVLDSTLSIHTIISQLETSYSNITASNVIGFSDAAYSSGQTATVLVVGAQSTDQSGLTPAQPYYVQQDGTLGTTPDTISVYAGTALSSTKLLIGREPSYVPPFAETRPHISATAVENITEGQALIMSGNGSVSPIGIADFTLDTSSTEVTIYSSGAQAAGGAWDPVNEVGVFCRSNDSGFFYFVPFTVSGNTITLGSASQYIAGFLGTIIYHPESGHFIAACNGTIKSMSNTGSGMSTLVTTTIPSSVGEIGLIYDPISTNIIYTYSDQTNQYAQVVQYDGSAFTLNTPVVCPGSDSVYGLWGNDTDGNGKFVTSWISNSAQYVAIGTISGTSITWGSPVQVIASAGSWSAAQFADGSLIYAYDDALHNFYVSVGTVSGNNVTFGTPIDMGYTINGNPGLYWEGTRAVMTTSDQRTFIGTLGTNTITFTDGVYGINSRADTVIFPISSTKLCAIYQTQPTYSVRAKVLPITSAVTNLTETNFIGFSAGTYSSGTTATVLVVGANASTLSSLVAGNRYYVQPDGSLATTAGTPSVYAGFGTSESTIVVKG